MPKAKKAPNKKATTKPKNKHQARRRSAPNKPFIVCPDTLEKVWITTVTLSDLQRAASAAANGTTNTTSTTRTTTSTTSKRRELLRIPSKQSRTAIYAEAARAIENKELECMALYGGRRWTVHAKVMEPNNHTTKKKAAAPLFRWFRGQLELATLPHLLAKIPDPPLLRGKQDYCVDDDEYVSSISLEERVVSSLSTVAWEDTQHAIPTVSLKWLSPDHVYFYSRKSAWEHQAKLAERQLFIQRIVHGIGFRGNKLKAFKVTKKDAIKAGQWRFLRDGLWVVGQEESWQAERHEWWQQEEERKAAEAEVSESKIIEVEYANDATAGTTASNPDSKPPATKRPLTGLQCFLRARRHSYREEKIKERAALAPDAQDSSESLQTMTLRDAENELRSVWKELSDDEKNEWTERAKKKEEEVAPRNNQNESCSDANCKPAAIKRPLTGLKCFLRARRHTYREEKNEERMSALGDSSEPVHNMTLKEAESELRSAWKALSDDQKNEWTERAKKEEDIESREKVDGSCSDDNCKSSARRSLTGLTFFLREERDKFREEKNKERALARGDSTESVRNMTLREAETELRNVWKTLTSSEKNDWADRAKKEYAAEEDSGKQPASTLKDSDNEIAALSEKDQPIQPVPSTVVASSTNGSALSFSSAPRLTPVSPSPPTAPTSDDERQLENTAPIPGSSLISDGNVVPISKAADKRCATGSTTNAEISSSSLEQGSNVLSVSVASGCESSARFTTATLSDDSKAGIGGTIPAHSNFKDEAKVEPISTPQQNRKKRKTSRAPPKKIVPSTQFRMTPDQIELCHTAVTKHFKTVMNTVKARALHSELQDGFDVLRERGRGRYDMELPEFDNPAFNFLTNLQSAAWMPIVRAVLGDDVVLIHKGAFLSMPGAEAQVYHQDGPHLTKQTQRPCHAVNVFIPLVDLHSRNGPTEFCLGTHVLGHEDYVKERVFTPQVPAGTPVIFDYRLGHRGLANSSSACRPIVYCTYAAAANGKEFRDSVNFSRKRYHKIGELVNEAPSREERAAKRRRRVSELEREQIATAVQDSTTESPSALQEDASEATPLAQPSSLSVPDNELECAEVPSSRSPTPDCESETRATTLSIQPPSSGRAVHPKQTGEEKEAEVERGTPPSIGQIQHEHELCGGMYPARLGHNAHSEIMAASLRSLAVGQLYPHDPYQQGGAQARQGYFSYRNPAP